MESVEDSLSLLGLEPGASWEEINEAYRDLVRVWHPDRFQNDERLRKKAEEQTRILNQAVRTLRENYVPKAAGSSKAVQNGMTSARSRAVKKQEFHSDLNRRADRTGTAKVSLAPLLVYQRSVASTTRIVTSIMVTYLGYFCVAHSQGVPAQTAFGCTMTFISLASLTKNLCLLLVRRPLIRVDASGLNSIDAGQLSWGDLAKVWTFVHAHVPSLAIECSDLYLKHQPLPRRMLMRLRHAFRSAHIVVTCSGLDAHPNDVVRAINAQHLTGNVNTPKVSTVQSLAGPSWWRLVSYISAGALILRCLLGMEMTWLDFTLYFTVFVTCQIIDNALRLLHVPART